MDEEGELLAAMGFDILFMGLFVKTFQDIYKFFKKEKKEKDEDQPSE
jgi:hypothetical protein